MEITLVYNFISKSFNAQPKIEKKIKGVFFFCFKHDFTNNSNVLVK